MQTPARWLPAPSRRTEVPVAFAASVHRLGVGALLSLAIASAAACGGGAQHALQPQSTQAAERPAASAAGVPAPQDDGAGAGGVGLRDIVQPAPDNPSDDLEREVASR